MKTGKEIVELIKSAGLEDKEVYVRVMDGGIEEVVGAELEEDGRYGEIVTERH